MESIDSIRKLLNSSTLKQRREGVKLLDTLLDSPVVLNQLDANTAKLWPEDKLTYTSWPGIVNLYLSYIDKEVLQHNKQLDSTALRVLRKIFAEADNTDRCVPGSRHLLRIAGYVFDKIKFILSNSDVPGDGLASPLGKEFVVLMQKALLPHQEYCQRSNVGAFQGILEEVMCRFEALQRKIDECRAASEAQTAAATAAGRLVSQAAAVKGRSAEIIAAEHEQHSMCGLLVGLLSCVPGQLNAQFAADSVGFCVEGLKWFANQRKFGKPELQLLSCLNGLLLLYGPELRPVVGPSCYVHLVEYVRQAWGERNTRLKEAVLCFCRVCLCLGGVQYAGHKALNDLQHLVHRDIQADNFTWDLQSNKQHQLLAALAASIYYHLSVPHAAAAAASQQVPYAAGDSGAAATAAGSGTSAGAASGSGLRRRRSGSAGPAAAAAAAAGGVDGDSSADGISDDESLPRKRSRLMEPQQQLMVLVDRQPERWCPVLALLVHLYGPLLPTTLHSAILQQLTHSVKQLLKDVASSSSSGTQSTTTTAAGMGPAYRRSTTPGPAGAPATAATAAAAAAKQQQQQLQLVWLLRCLTELALCWPAELHPAAAATGSSHVGCSRGVAAAATQCTAVGSADIQAAAAAAAARCWQQVWDSMTEAAAATASKQQDESQSSQRLITSCTEPLSWLLHVMLARRLIRPPSRTAVLSQLLPLLLQQQQPPASQQQQQQHEEGDSFGDLQQQQQQYVPLQEAQLALLITLCAGEHISSQSDMKVRQQMLLACLATAEAYCCCTSSSGRISSTGYRVSNTGAADRAIPAAVPGSSAAAAASCLPELLLPAILVLLEAPGLPTPGLNGACGAFQIPANLEPSNSSNHRNMSGCWAALLNPRSGVRNSSSVTFQPGVGCNTVWYNTSSWWLSDRRVEVLFEGLDHGADCLQRKLAATRLQQVLSAASAAAGAAAVLDMPAGNGSPQSAAAAAGAGSSNGSSPSTTTSNSSGVSAGWKCWCSLADWMAETLTHALTAALPDPGDGHDQQQQQQGWPQAPDNNIPNSSSSSRYNDPTKQVSHLLLLANISANLPCIAAVKCAQLQLVQQEHQESIWCGVGFSGTPGLHVQLQRLMMQLLEHCGDLLKVHISDLSCSPGSSWISQLQHLGATLARLQRLTDTLQAPPATAAGQQQQQQAASSQQIALAVAAGVLQPVVLALQKAISDAAAAAVAAASDPQFRKVRTVTAGDIDLDDDFTPAPPPSNRGVSPTVSNISATPAHQGFAAIQSATQQSAGFGTQGTGMGPPASKPPAAAGSSSSSGPPGYTILMTGGLAGFSGRPSAVLGSRVLVPSLVGSSDPSSDPDQDICGSSPAGFRQGFRVAGLNEGLAGLSGAQGVGLRVLAALSPACGPDAAQGLLQLWRHVSGVAGGAPTETLLEGLVEAMTAAVCAGGWLQLGQLFGMLQGDHALLSPSKVPLSTLHLVLRLIQAVAVSAPAAGVDLCVARGVFMSAVSQGSVGIEPQAMDVDGANQGSLLDELLEIFNAVHARLEKHRTAGDPVIGHNPLPQVTQLQLGLTIVALLQLMPEHAYGSSSSPTPGPNGAARVASTPDAYALSGSLDESLARSGSLTAVGVVEAYRTELLDLLDSGSYTLRIRAGPLVAQLLADTAAAAVHPAGGSSRGIGAAMRIAMVDIQRHLQLQTLNRLTEDQQTAVDLIRSVPGHGDDPGPRLDAIRNTKNMLLRWETAVVQVADLAAATPLTAAAALQLQEAPNLLDNLLLLPLLGHAAVTQQLPVELLPALNPAADHDSRTSCLQLATAAADLMAAQQQYGDRFGYLQYHAAAVMWQWFASGKHTFEQLTLLQPLLCQAAAGADTGVAAAAVLDQYGSSITVSLMHNIDSDQQLAAVAGGVQVPALFEHYKIDLFGTLLPLTKYPQLKPRVSQLADKAGKTPRTTIATRLVLLDRFFRLSLPAIITIAAAAPDPQQQQEQWAAAVDKRDAAALFYPQPVAKQACMAFAEALSREDVAKGDLSGSESWFIKSHLRPRGMMKLLLNIHRNITTAAHPVHKLQRLGQIELLLHLLQPAEVTTPAVARYLITILVQHVQQPGLQSACCDFMEIIFQQLYQAAAVHQSPAGSKSSSKPTATAAAKAAGQEQQQHLAAAVLAELLPPTVAALVQCVETAAAARQQQQRQIMWSTPSKTAAAVDPFTAGSSPLDLPRDHPAVRLLTCLLHNPPAGLLPVVATLDLLPPLPVLAAAAAMQQKQQQGCRLPERIVMLADRISGMAASSRQRSIQAIRSHLQHNSQELYSTPADSSTSSASSQQQQERQQVDPAVTAAAFKLAKLGAQSCNVAVTSLAAQLLAITGPLDPDIITFQAAAGSRSRSSGHDTDFPIVTVLQHLISCLFDCQPYVVEVAQTTLTQLLATADGKAALQMLLPGSKGSAAAVAAAGGDTSLLFSGLHIFTDEANTAQDKRQQQQQQQQFIVLDQEAAAAALAAVTSASSWSPLGKPYNSWLCWLCSTLLTACGTVQGPNSNQTLPLLAAAAALRPQLAELLVPHALLLLSSSDGSGSDIAGAGSSGLAARLGSAITQGLDLGLHRSDQSRSRPVLISSSGLLYSSSSSSTDEPAAVDSRCLNALIACLEHNRHVHRKAMMALANPQQEPQPATAWHRCYCLHIDYLAVAAAAMACKAYFTALIYIEFWCEEQYGKLTYNPSNVSNVGDDSAYSSGISQLLQLVAAADPTAGAAGQPVQQQQRQMLEDLLLDLYSNVNEPDGIYAVAAAFSSNACQLHLLRHEQQWDKVLGAEDALLQTAAVQQQQGLAASNTGVLSALHLLGCQATAQQCLATSLNAASQGSSIGSNQQQQQLHDMQCELAWRLSDWGIADALQPDDGNTSSYQVYGHQHGSTSSTLTVSGPDSSSSSSFNSSVLAALQALQSRNAESFMSNVSSAQHACVLHLARSSTQSAAAINPILVKLKMCNMLQKGFETSDTAAAAADTAEAEDARSSAEQLLQKLLGVDYLNGGRSAAAEQLGVSRFQLSDQLVSLQAAVCKVLRRPDALALTLQAQASTARLSGQANFASAALRQLQTLLLVAAAPVRPASGWPAPAAGGSSARGVPDRKQLPGWLISLTSPDADWVLESVRLKWLQGQQLPAFRELQGMITALKAQQQLGGTSAVSKVRSGAIATALMLAQAQAGEWMAAGQFSNSAADALSLYHDAAAIAQQQQQQPQQPTGSSSEQHSVSQLHCQVFFQLATYADQRFREIELQMASPEWQKQLKVLDSKRQLLQQLEKLEPSLRKQYQTKASTKTASAAQVAAHYKETLGRLSHTRRTVAADAEVIEQRTAQRAQCLKLALSNYRACIASGNSHDLQVVYRLCSLWFKHWQDPAVNAELAAVFDSVPSAKFVPLVYQIASRLDSTSTHFQAVLNTALTKLCRDHPYHTLYSLIALKNGGHGKQTGPGVLVEHETDESKVAAAAALLDSLKAAQPGRLKAIIDDMNGQVQVFIDIHSIMSGVPRDSRGSVNVASYAMPATYRRKLQDFKHAPPICLSLDVDLTCRYGDVPYVVSVDSTIDFCGGINCPMVIKSVDSTGRRQRQLAKSGNDDLRQDAVMQQFFGLVNALLGSSAASRQRRLGIRTYRVVPCSPTSGVLEWVEGTKPMTDYLAEGRQREGGAIAIYRKPGNLTWYNCYMELQKAWGQQNQQKGKQTVNLKDKFLEVCARFPPVFHHFFLESFPDPAAWFEARSRYTRSTAVNSMAGYLVGLGDRHMGNILLDMGTAEVVHIDLGIAFEQGMFLNTPERVPFRLTANVVDGMGAAGTEGPFRRCCETTLEVLRSHKEALLTVVEVVLHDPLYKWQMTTVKAQRKQQDPLVATAAATGSGAAAAAGSGSSSGGAGGPSSTSIDEIGNADAERAVLRVKQKLEGQDVEGGAALSVAAQVGVLMAAAQDPDNLCRMFIGWAAFM